MSGRPYEHTVEDALFLWENGVRDIKMIEERLGIGRDAINKAFRYLNLVAPWRTK